MTPQGTGKTTVNHFTDFYNAEKHGNKYDAVISIGHILNTWQYRDSPMRLYFDFQDINKSRMAANPTASFADGPQMRHIKALVRFYRLIKPETRVLVHCFAGYSRSAAAVVIARCERDGLTMEEALVGIDQLRIPDTLVPDPNDVMLDLYQQLLTEEKA
jgi:predicted protein tyrosine phosphatase